MPERKIGIVKWFDAKRGYGFISVDDQDDIKFLKVINVDLYLSPFILLMIESCKVN